MKVFYDGFIFTLQSSGGINRYFSSLIDYLPNDIEPTLITCMKRDLTFPTNPNLKVKIHKRFAFQPGRLAFLLEKHLFQYDYYRDAPDIFHPSYYLTLLRRRFDKFKVPIVVTVYDCIVEHFGEEFDPTGLERQAKREMIESADAILAISHSTKEDIIRFYKIPEDRIIVHHLGSNIEAETEKFKSDIPYFLFVGNRWSYKNFDLAYQAVQNLNASGNKVELKVVGPPFSVEERAIYRSEYVRHLGPIDDTALSKLYAGTLALVYPSSYEGFGLPPLEAMRCGAPVICCNTTSLPEVVGNAGILIKPDSLDELVDAMKLVSLNENLREKQIELGLLQSKKFSWESSAATVVETYRDLI